MLNNEDNELLCAIGPGTLMGDVMRQYWIPAIRSDELPRADCPPLRVKLLGEDLIGFRMTSGTVGLIQNSCPHRGASLFFGRNEEEGLRCVYHGWKYDVTGQCIDMPSEPPEAIFKTKVRAVSYPCIERNGIIWGYMGPREIPPPLPDIEATLLNTDPKHILILHRTCNWMQAWEGDMDTVHAGFLHFGAVKLEDLEPGTFEYYQVRQKYANFSVIETEIGASYGAYRPAEDDTNYWRIAHMLFPFYSMIPEGKLGEQVKIGMYVPMDDKHTLHWEIFIRPEGPHSLHVPATTENPGTNVGIIVPTVIPGSPQSAVGAKRRGNTPDWYGRFNIERSMANDYFIDREAQQSFRSFSGISGVRQQDMAVTESMGSICNRSIEHLGSTDQMIIRTRSKLITTAKALRAQAIVPPGVDSPRLYRMRSGETILPRDVDWWESTRELRERFDPRAEQALAASNE